MIPPVPYFIRLPLAFSCVSMAILVRTSAGIVADGFRALGEWFVPELRGPR
ncbi:hypothetical protein [Antarcticirhabdus aurantiaca]|uniref:Uncharacterized protein n=1 Tax=Antarcticirhabdus aurantiaca TaxID=2606717 RepID=A0ACD4NMH4_9HYPH|nr:hypothetical protein [Antarcticirhabdus aurantiaca]WAJ28041.1 hypothetical protein OXU80_24975 [Jeongeuplla avenae]